MRPTVNSDESVTADRSVNVVRYIDHPSRHPKEQISDTKNAQTEYEAHLLQNAAHSSTYKSNTIPLDRHNPVYRERRVNGIVENQSDVSKDSEQREQKHISVDTRDIDFLYRYRSKSCIPKLHLWCARWCRRKKEYSKRVLGEPSRWFLEHMRERGRECAKPDDIAVTVSATLHREPISRRSAPRKFKRGRKQDEAVEVTDKDVFEGIREERRRRERKEKKRRERRERRKWEERAPHFIADTHLVARDEDLEVPEDHVLEKPPLPLTDFTKSCCYLCAQNTLAIATASAKPEQSDKGVQVSAHKFHAETPPKLDKSCSPILLVRTIQSSVKVRTRETSTLCPGTSLVERRETEPRSKKRKKFNVFLGLTRTKCPAGRRTCEIDKAVVAGRDDNAEKREPRNEKCCREKNA